MTQPPVQSRWIILALASGTFAALNGLFAKLTTDEQTTAFTRSISHLFGAGDQNTFLELLVRGVCLGLNVLCNIIMWALFTRALTASPSTTKVSITNTSANFLITALLGMIVFREKVSGLWWLGAAMMGGGCILVGMRDS
ncbi:hypothetical protein KXW98_003797 [Aspergillus fumigatus]|uniref:EamA domain-containing protein n=1 Tax=Aspergillus fumigatus TaxID=746128 RepID=A0A229Y3F9_ASPFM|nr:hypothetical protein CNMCM8714_000136 [Aspergillus fumigatus]KAF4265242.1 hypothetical protein CNMCM8057_000592 [Aspergillus fumigatus]KAF4265597.1 hypothetical protein CNMCM8812_003081 [Aspergillus fumigatus]KAF4280485.1 hypothetical protein CNMCM8689_001987 [Aspergillus fumigatus]KAF4290462.1 hypothetical protein CNMCM8686_001111 [Aspergillus fumigatus]